VQSDIYIYIQKERKRERMEDTYLILEEVPTNSPSYSPKKNIERINYYENIGNDKKSNVSK